MLDDARPLPARRPSRHPRIPARLLRLASDEHLVELVRGGSEPAFEALYDRHHRGILTFCRHMLGSPHEAEDAVQLTFLAAYADLVGSRKPIELRAWLYTIARNRCVSMLRARREQPLADVDEPATEHLAAAVQRRQDLRDLLRDVGLLPVDQRAALVLASLGDVSHREIADVLGVRREKVKALVFQARSSLLADRTARETPCADVRQQLLALRGGALRRGTLRRHLRECPGCGAFRAALRDQRRKLALALPVAPSLALKAGVLGGGSGAAASGATALTAKVLVAATLAGGGGAVGVRELTAREPASPHAPAAERAAPSRTTPRAAPAPAVVGGEGQAPAPPRRHRAEAERPRAEAPPPKVPARAPAPGAAPTPDRAPKLAAPVAGGDDGSRDGDEQGDGRQDAATGEDGRAGEDEGDDGAGDDDDGRRDAATGEDGRAGEDEGDDGAGEDDDRAGEDDDRAGKDDDRAGDDDDRAGEDDDGAGKGDDRAGEGDDGAGKGDDGAGKGDDGAGKHDDGAGEDDNGAGEDDDGAGEDVDGAGKNLAGDDGDEGDD